MEPTRRLSRGITTADGRMTVEAKETVRALPDRLPDDCSVEDVLYHLCVLQAIERGQADVTAGRIIPQEEAESAMRRGEPRAAPDRPRASLALRPVSALVRRTTRAPQGSGRIGMARSARERLEEAMRLAERNPAARGFLEELRRAVDAIAASPGTWPRLAPPLIPRVRHTGNHRRYEVPA
jgi:hypothetical protein